VECRAIITKKKPAAFIGFRRLLHPARNQCGGEREEGVMGTIGHVTRRKDGSYEGELKTMTIRAELLVTPIKGKKSSDSAPDFRVTSNGVEIGAGWIRTGQASGKEYVSLSLSAPELGPKPLYANLGRMAGQDDDDVFALIWNP
jgi:uncharacterized protein (DUF736 family)